MTESSAMSSREAILSRVRGIVGEARDADTVGLEWAALPRAYNAASAADRDAVLLRLIDRLHDYDAQVYRVSPEEIAGTVREIVSLLGLTEVLVPAGLAQGWLPDGVAFVKDEGFSPRELDRFTAVLTGSTLAIAETGTLVLQNLPGQGRRAATLVPDVHLCVVREQDVVATVPEAMRRLQATAELPTTFISGPSATADIEMTRIKGVHGPRFLHVLLVR
ncbi:LutC/YkgG family protein [Terriglobus aquaticus]|uniref:Lactate utilization protein C n=1 Tax=Terriglobus aquaticus TaxID=940139 RepID=A0ABW9KRH9_9BACT|nr:LUD domain-containing protein [Terriglobus aquaticus]